MSWWGTRQVCQKDTVHETVSRYWRNPENPSYIAAGTFGHFGLFVHHGNHHFWGLSGFPDDFWAFLSIFGHVGISS